MIISQQKSKWWNISSSRITTRRAILFTCHCHLVTCTQYLLVAPQHAQYPPPEMHVLHSHTAILHPTGLSPAPAFQLPSHSYSIQTSASCTAQDMPRPCNSLAFYYGSACLAPHCLPGVPRAVTEQLLITERLNRPRWCSSTARVNTTPVQHI